MSTTVQRVHEWLTVNGPAAGPEIRAALAVEGAKAKTVKQSLTRMRAQGAVTLDDGLWSAVPVEDAGPDLPGDPAGLEETGAEPAEPLAVPSWRDALGEICTEPDAGCPGHCPCGGAGKVRYTSCHTGTVCEECGPADCWAPSPAAEAKAAEHATAERAAAIRTGQATARISQEEIDRQARVAFRMRKNRLTWISERLNWHLGAGTQADLEWFDQEVTATVDAARLNELGKGMLALGLDEPPPLRLIIIPADAEDDDGQAPAGRTGEPAGASTSSAAARPRLTIAPPPSPDCGRCGSEPVIGHVRISHPHIGIPDGQPVCAGCHATYQDIAGRMSFVRYALDRSRRQTA